MQHNKTQQFLIKELTATCGFSPQDGNILDFRNQGVQLFVIDKNNILKPGREYNISIDLLNTYVDNIDTTDEVNEEVSGVSGVSGIEMIDDIGE